MGTAHHSCDAATGFAAVATRPRAGCWSMEDRRWPYQPKHSHSRYTVPQIDPEDRDNDGQNLQISYVSSQDFNHNKMHS